MNTSSLDAKITDKHFLKQNDLAQVLKDFVANIGVYKMPLVVVAVLLLLVLIGVPTQRYLKQRQMDGFARALYAAEQMPGASQAEVEQKITAFNKVIAEHADFPAVRIARLNLAALLSSQKKNAEALTIVDEGLKASTKADILSTLLVFKKVGLLKSEGKFAEAAMALTGVENQVIPTLKDQLKLLKAELLLLTGKKDEAKTLYEQLSVVNIQAEGKSLNLMDAFDPTVSNQARDRLLLMDLEQL